MFYKLKKLSVLVLLILVLTGSRICYSSDLKDLQKKLELISKAFKGKIGVSLHHLKTGDRLDLLGDEKFPAASTIKVALLGVVMEKIEKGELNYYQKFAVTEDEISGGTGFIRNYKVGKQITLKELVHFMITASDNTATLMVMRAIGSDITVNDWLKRNNLPVTRLNISYPFSKEDWNDKTKHQKIFAEFDKWGMGVSTPNEMRLLMEMIAVGTLPAGARRRHRHERRRVPLRGRGHVGGKHTRARQQRHPDSRPLADCAHAGRHSPWPAAVVHARHRARPA